MKDWQVYRPSLEAGVDHKTATENFQFDYSQKNLWYTDAPSPTPNNPGWERVSDNPIQP